jgi:hypothetical protein
MADAQTRQEIAAEVDAVRNDICGKVHHELVAGTLMPEPCLRAI